MNAGEWVNALPESRHRAPNPGAAGGSPACQALFPAHHIRLGPGKALGWEKGNRGSVSAVNHPISPRSAWGVRIQQLLRSACQHRITYSLALLPTFSALSGIHCPKAASHLWTNVRMVLTA